MTVPEPALPLLVRGLGAYMRSAPVLDLPPELRKLRNFHSKMLMAHAADVVSLLDDEAARALVLQWLDDPAQTVPKKQAQALRVAAAREEGWEEALAELAGRPAPSPDPTQKLRAALERETEKAAAAREETRRIKESSRQSLDDERAKTKELRQELQAARREAETNAAEAERARTEAERALAETEKLERRARKDVAAAEEKARDATRELRSTRKELNAARRRIAELEDSLERARAPKPRPRKTDVPAGPRRPLPVPKGRLADDPLTLDAWLDAPGAHLLVDGYNVTKSAGGFPDLDLPSQRERLLEQLERLALRKGVPTTVVFDGSDVAPGRSRLGRARVRVEYSRPGETADDHLIAKLAALPPDPVVLVTGDRELQERASAEGATIAIAAQLLELSR